MTGEAVGPRGEVEPVVVEGEATGLVVERQKKIADATGSAVGETEEANVS